MTEIEKCPVCGSTSFNFILNCKDYSVTQDDFKLMQCNHCDFLMTSPRPDHNNLAKYYSSANYISHSDTKKGLINKLYHIVRNFTLQQKIKIITNYFTNPVLLDIGSGAGYFLNACNQNGFDVSGIEPDEHTRIRSMQQFDIHVYEEDQLNHWNENTFEVITLWHVLEHVEDPGMRLMQIHKLLKQNGILILALPNCSSHDAGYYKSFWAGYDVPRHLWHFTPDTIKNFAEKYQFKIERTLPMYFDSFYVSMLSEKYKKSMFGFAKGMWRGFISNAFATFSNYDRFSSQIYILKKQNTNEYRDN